MRILLVDTYYPEFLNDLYAEDASVSDLEFEEQLGRIFASAFGVGDAYSHNLRQLHGEASEVICNADAAQARWAKDHNLSLVDNLHDRRRQIVSAQVAEYRPDVLYVFEWSPLGDAFLAEMKSRVRLLVGQIASPLPDDRTFAAYDLMISSFPPIVHYFRTAGMDSELLRLAFDPRIPEKLSPQAPLYDVTFVGGFAPSHEHRVPWLERLLSDLSVDVFGYGIERVPTGSPIRAHYRGSAWGWRMYEVLQRSRITLNLHARISVRGTVHTRFANNMRLYEATGVGTCLVTESKENMAELFEPGKEVVTYDDPDECVEKLRYYLGHDAARCTVGQAGQARTLATHTYAHRIAELLDILHRHLPAPRHSS